MHAIPKKIHIIWLGGDVPPRNRVCIATFPRKNPDYEINLWYDSRQMLTAQRIKKVKEDYTKRTPQGGPVKADGWKEVANQIGKEGGDTATIIYLKNQLNINIGNSINDRENYLNSIDKFCKSNGLKLRDVQKDLKMGKNGPYYLQELVNRGANFGAASDILRIEILLQYGGIYVDTDVSCVEAIGELVCHQSYPRFSAVNPLWEKGIGKADWEDDNWWKNNFSGQQAPSISNSIIASHARCKGLRAYRDLINKNFNAIKKSDELREQYFKSIDNIDAFRSHTVRNTGPTAASNSTGFNKARNASANDDNARQFEPERKIEMRDNWYFPMFCVVDGFFHDWAVR
jgi:hypothetical protein